MFGSAFWRFGRAADPFSELLRLRGDVQRLFPTTYPTAASAYPAVNIWMNEGGAVMTAEIPGLDPDKVEVSVTGDVLTLSGNRPKEALKEGDGYHRKERAVGSFSRTLQFPFRIDSGKIVASYEKGILTVTLPREEADRPRKIAIKAA